MYRQIPRKSGCTYAFPLDLGDSEAATASSEAKSTPAVCASSANRVGTGLFCEPKPHRACRLLYAGRVNVTALTAMHRHPTRCCQPLLIEMPSALDPAQRDGPGLDVRDFGSCSRWCRCFAGAFGFGAGSGVWSARCRLAPSVRAVVNVRSGAHRLVDRPFCRRAHPRPSRSYWDRARTRKPAVPAARAWSSIARMPQIRSRSCTNASLTTSACAP